MDSLSYRCQYTSSAIIRESGRVNVRAELLDCKNEQLETLKNVILLLNQFISRSSEV